MSKHMALGAEHGMSARSWPSSEQLFIAGVIASGAVVTGLAVHATVMDPPDWRWVILVALTVLSGTFTLRMPIVPVSFSISDTFTFAAVLLFGWPAGTIVVAIDSIVMSTKLWRKQRSVRKFAFNATAPALAMCLAAFGFSRLTGTGSLADHPGGITRLLPQLAAFAGLYFVLNTGLIAVAVAIERRQRVWVVWREHFLGLWLTYFGGAAAAAIALLLTSAHHNELAIVGLVASIPLMLYAGFRTAIARMQDSVSHLSKVNALYLSTIETLAQAIDARDQVTHDHIRRVQEQALRLARELGIDDEQELRALEAASLLHDMGKLAVPDHILNKPGKLTTAEYERIKTHAAVGADILAPIGFPFPVEPIVRHHHENWDGSGYPSGLAGHQIPIGARILQVVDCFDALTSDRPYRPAMSVEEALSVIKERRGTMYDPEVVAAFVRMIETSPVDVPRRAALAAISGATAGGQDGRLDGAAISTRTLIGIAGELGKTIGSASDAHAACTTVCERLATLLPDVTVTIYRYASDLDALCVEYGAGTHADAIGQLTIPMGQRLTGWVTAQRSTIINSDAALDLGNLTRRLRPRPRHCVSTCIAVESEVVGALTLYSTRGRPFTDSEVALIELVAQLIARPLARGPHARLALASPSMEVRVM